MLLQKRVELEHNSSTFFYGEPRPSWESGFGGGYGSIDIFACRHADRANYFTIVRRGHVKVSSRRCLLPLSVDKIFTDCALFGACFLALWLRHECDVNEVPRSSEGIILLFQQMTFHVQGHYRYYFARLRFQHGSLESHEKNRNLTYRN